MNNRTYTVYGGYSKKKKLLYIGTTIQKPSARFRWHKANGKPFNFKVLYEFDNAEDMINKEYELIKQLRPPENKITHRKQNLNRKLTPEILEDRKNSDEWCKKCLRRRVNKGYTVCAFC